MTDERDNAGRIADRSVVPAQSGDVTPTASAPSLPAGRQAAARGHLHEAPACALHPDREDESKAWPDLHTAIREARRAYQAAGTMPEWKVSLRP